MIMAAKALLQRNTVPTEEEIKKALSGNLCRCTGYVNITHAILSAAEEIRKGRDAND
jgi:carbon-monoxide dehydrogenase small subunit